MVNTRNKGNRVQRDCIARLQLSGFLVSKVEKGGKFAKEKDMFGLYDLVAIKKGMCLFVQVTCNRPHTHQDYQQFSKDYSNNGIEFWQMIKYDNKGWRNFQYRFGGKIEYDERK